MTITPLQEKCNALIERFPEFVADLTSIGISRELLIEDFLLYNSNAAELDNDVYARPGVRAAMYLEYQTPGSWHEHRQGLLLGFIQKMQPQSILDLGFGAPLSYIRDYVFQQSGVQLTLSDKYPQGFPVADLVLKRLDPAKAADVQYKELDMVIEEYVGDYDFYIFLDSIEHAPRPFEYLSLQVNHAPENAAFAISIPIGPLIERHSMAWESEAVAVSWLESTGLKVLEVHQVRPNVSVDTFAEGLDIYDLIVLAQKA